MISRTWKTTVLIPAPVVFAGLIANYLLFDWWRINGIVIDEATGNPIAHVQVLLVVEGSEPRPFSESRGLSVVCIDSRVVTTDESGAFMLSERTAHQFLARKRVKSLVSNSQVAGTSYGVQLHTGIFGSVATPKIVVRSLVHNETSGSEIGDSHANSVLLAAAAIGQTEFCGAAGWEFAVSRFEQSLSFVANHRDAQSAIDSCKQLQRVATTYNERRRPGKISDSGADSEYIFRWNCEKLPIRVG